MKAVQKWSVTVALAGFLFGFDTVVISGANLPVKELWNLSPWFHGLFIMSMALWGTVLGSLTGGIPCDKFGRKKTLFWIGILYFASALGSALSPDPYLFSFFRFIGGVGVGASSVAAPTYISEITTASNRGKLVALYQFNLVLGILIAFFSNYLLEGFQGENDWRWMMGVEAIPAFLYTVLVMTVPESPRWLLHKKKDEKAAFAVLNQVYDKLQTQRKIDSIKTELAKTTDDVKLFTARFKKPLILAFLIAFFNQVSGINFILYYAPEILVKAGLATEDSLLNSISIGVVNLVFTFVGVGLIDRLGRRTLMFIGSFGYIISLVTVAWCFYSGASSAVLLTFILIFIASHAVGQGAVIWVFISEVFPNKVRAYGQSWGTGTHWVFAALITLLTPVFLDGENGIFKDNPWPIFAFFAFMMFLQLLFTKFMMPETKGISLEELEEKILG
ncbi:MULTISPECIES: sugar porter family MFS transporter [Leeuwenhoekiella]|jgi:sugar porter (SP) family MFS transporter|uniref:Xylose transporter n=2 Tax=Leeuwenhoekiella TaxID=283735 RepID=A3XK55_LEEBM|nr:MULTISPECIES: sugar porter family MFS transporter [Leeuwenhoekiella]EAQ50064.1 xylose transporter [Leeuwenhoekiella blandensis MED217]MAO43387.1 sugar porter family MFS transporter [Leeuwenhoekiella sp.]HBT09756.1 sugar porter family MFS transporter [Leeuwenhoekiella sp.]HCW63173.1 sugar porter family MFS transporter [Leeuwenhoekiella sp.]|tara:strand:+ start:100338 stop:101675 length:1338 start_codon:yes stop_codon:yes gene_type:complete